MRKLVHVVAGLLVAFAINTAALAAGRGNDAVALTGRVMELVRAGKYSEAIPLAQRALAIDEKTLGPNHLDVARSLNDLANLYDEQGRYAEAAPLHLRALAIREKALGPNHLEVTRSLNNLGTLYYSQGRYAEAEPLFKRTLAIREKTLGLNHPDVATALLNLAATYNSQGRNTETEPLIKRALAIEEKALGLNHRNVALDLTNLAALYANQGRYAEAEPLMKRALAIREKVLGPDHPDVGRSQYGLATLYMNQRRYAEAEPLFKRALSVQEKAFGPDHPKVADSLSNLASLYQNLRRYADAEQSSQRSLAIYEKAFGPNHPDVALSLNSLAALYQNQSRYSDALPAAQRVIANGRAQPSVILPVLFDAQRENLMSAEKTIDAALNVIQRGSQSSAAAAVSKLAVRLAAGNDRLAQLVRKDQDLATEADALDKAIIAAVSKEPSKRDAAAERRTKDQLAAVAAERGALQKTFASEFPEYTALSNPLPLTGKEIQAVLSDDEVLVLFSATGDKESYVFSLTRNSFTWKAIPLGAEALSQKVGAFRRGLDVNKISSEQDASGKTALFDLNLANELYAALLGPVETLLKDKKQLLVVPSGALTALPFHLLVTEKPVAALPEKFDGYRDAAWLIKRQAVTVLPSIASLKALRSIARNDQSSKPMIGFGDPMFDPDQNASDARDTAAKLGTTKSAARNLTNAPYTQFWKGAGIDRSRLARALPQLPDTADELKAVALKLGVPASDIHLGSDASETTVKRAPLSDYRIVYFATHGLVAGDVKGLAEPSLALSIPRQPTEFDDGLLTASEVAQLKLNADWVVLSACNTIAGDKPGAEALSGLARSFFYAGARALLVSHWAVDSEAATRITTTTFDRLKTGPGIGRAEALRQAMLDYLGDTSSPKNAYPAFWAPFALIGEGAAR